MLQYVVHTGHLHRSPIYGMSYSWLTLVPNKECIINIQATETQNMCLFGSLPISSILLATSCVSPLWLGLMNVDGSMA